MRLLTESIERNLEVLTENSKGGPKKTFIEGIFMQAEVKNRNGRVYSRKVLEGAVKDFNEKVKAGRAIGELDHPTEPTINLDRVSHRITELNWQGSNVVGKALVLETPCGKILNGLLEGGVQLGVSSRGMGSLRQQEGVAHVADDFVLSTVDVVQDPSAHDAFVNSIMENTEWVQDKAGNWKPKSIDKIETELFEARVLSLSDIDKFLSRL